MVSPQKSSRGRLAAGLAAALLCVALARLAGAQSSADLAERDHLFEQLLADPTNADLTMRYAAASAQAGDIEGAISALEGLLIADPGQPDVRVQLGLLYSELGSYDMARSYLQPVAESDAVPAELRAEAEDGLRQVASRASPHKFSGTLFFGVQSQSNPGSNPVSQIYLVSGSTQALGPQFAQQHDQNVFAQATGSYAYDFANVHGDRLELDGLGYTTYYNALRAIDLAWLRLAAGPRLGLDRVGLAGGSLKPYLLGDYVGLGQRTYYWGLGGGLEYAQKLNQAGRKLVVVYESEAQNYSNSSFYPTARQLTGRFDHVSLGLVEPLPVGIGSTVALAGIVNRQEARSSFYRNTDGALQTVVTFGYGAPLDLPYAWATSLGFTGHFIGYDAADPTVSKSIVRNDWRTEYVLTQVVPVLPRASLVGQLYHDVVYSNIRNYSYGNTSVLVGMQVVF